jgi:short subunit dehydrogenase-like uncharacterized protein
MKAATAWMIYGANGYTGRLIAMEAKRQGLVPVLAGRSAAPVQALAADLGLPWRAFDLRDPTAAPRALADVRVVANCAGPFSATGRPMIDACLAAGTHYVDITGEIDVFVGAEHRHPDANASGIVLCPGVGFDVIPTDCVAACLKQALPDATHLALGFKGPASRSPGTARTSVEAAATGGRVRENGVIVTVPLADRTRNINFGDGTRFAVAIPWGDVATAYFTTGIANIETYVPASPRSAQRLRRSNWLRPLLRARPLLLLAQHVAGRANAGPSPEERSTGKMHVWGEARNGRDQVRTARLTTSNGYRLTVDGVLMAVRTLQARAPEGGYYTPTQLMGPRCVERLPGSSAIAIE